MQIFDVLSNCSELVRGVAWKGFDDGWRWWRWLCHITGIETELDLRTADRDVLIDIIIRQQAVIEGLKKRVTQLSGGWIRRTREVIDLSQITEVPDRCFSHLVPGKSLPSRQGKLVGRGSYDVPGRFVLCEREWADLR